MAGCGSDRTGEAGKAGQRLEWIGGVRQAGRVLAGIGLVG